MNSNTVITISRQYGCGGRELAEILAKKLNVNCTIDKLCISQQLN